jgi:site-specific recombinase XerD
MRTYQPTGLGRSIVGFFQEYLPTLRGMSRHTIQSYRDGLVLFLQFAATDCGRAIESLEVADITADRVGHFLAFLETARRNSITTRNARLAALHTFARFLVAGNPDHMAALQQVLGIPFKRGARAAPIEYLEKAEIEVLLAGIDRSTLSGQRDNAMFSLMFNTGARVQEILNLRVRDVRLEPPFQVRLAGKGNKMRICPIWPRTAQLLKNLIQKQHAGVESPADQSIFLNERGAAMTRFGVRYLLQKYVAAGTTAAPTLAG